MLLSSFERCGILEISNSTKQKLLLTYAPKDFYNFRRCKFSDYVPLHSALVLLYLEDLFLHMLSIRD
jgi:hypothetical protein